MASLIKAKIKQFPSGLNSLVFSHVVAGAPLGSRAKVRQAPIEIVSKVLIARAFGLIARQALRAGHGGLGNKDRMSWKTCRQIRERMASIEIEYGINNCGFLTLTLPSVSPDSFESLSRFSSYAMDRLNREFNRYFQGDNLARVSVWEYQKRGALHCHLLLASDSLHTLNAEEFRLHICDVWNRILRSIGDMCKVNMFKKSNGETWNFEELKLLKNDKNGGIFVNYQKVEKSIVAYLSSYLADSNHEKDKKNKNFLRGKFFPIATWAQWNRKATECYRQYYEEFELGECEPDKNPTLKNAKEWLHFEILKRIPLKRNTEVKQPTNPYNFGLYFLPAHPRSENLSNLILEFIERIAFYFREKLRPNIERENREDVEVFWSTYDLFLSLKGRFKRQAKKLFLNGHSPDYVREKMLEYCLCQFEVIDRIEAKSRTFFPLQLDIEYGQPYP